MKTNWMISDSIGPQTQESLGIAVAVGLALATPVSRSAPDKRQDKQIQHDPHRLPGSGLAADMAVEGTLVKTSNSPKAFHYTQDFFAVTKTTVPCPTIRLARLAFSNKLSLVV